MNDEIIIASMLPEKGTTGVQSHFNSLNKYVSNLGITCKVITPYSYKSSIFIRGINFLNGKLSFFNKELSILLSREIRILQIKMNFKKYLSETTAQNNYYIYAQDPSTALMLTNLKDSSEVKQVTLICHFNISEAYEYTLQKNTSINGILGKYLFKIEAEALKNVDQVIFPSEFVKKHVLERNKLLKFKSFIIPNFTDPLTNNKNTNYPDVDFISIGTLETRKNQQFAIRLIYELNKLGYEKRLMLVGDGPDKEMLIKLANDLNISNLIIFAGFVPNAKALIKNAKYYLHTAFLENLSIALIESLSQGIPICAPNTGGNPEIFRDKKEGIFIDLNDIEKSAKASTLFFEESRYKVMSKNAIDRFNTVFSTDINAPIFLQTILGRNT